jgi:hypothetical protein
VLLPSATMASERRTNIRPLLRYMTSLSVSHNLIPHFAGMAQRRGGGAELGVEIYSGWAHATLENGCVSGRNWSGINRHTGYLAEGGAESETRCGTHD